MHACIFDEWGRRGMHIGYWWGSQKVRDHWEDLDVGGWTILKWILGPLSTTRIFAVCRSDRFTGLVVIHCFI
jgi:hypothetical protein